MHPVHPGRIPVPISSYRNPTLTSINSEEKSPGGGEVARSETRRRPL